MTNLIVASFANEVQAISGSHKLAKLESVGDITIYEKVMIRKEPKGDVTVLQENTSNGLRAISGTALGSLIGVLVGPVGLLVGTITGTLASAAFESGHFDFSEDIVAKVKDCLQPGMVAIIAEVYEQGPAFLDNGLEPLGATIYRSNVDDVYDKYLDEQIHEINDKIAAQRKKLKSAITTEKSKIQQKIEQSKEKRRHRLAELEQKQKKNIAKIKTSLTEEKKSRLKDKIYRHQARIAELEEKLKETQHQH
jgi:uncharacterized membrane protein